MILMKNKYLKFNKIELENGKILSNISELNLLPRIPEKYLKTENLRTLHLDSDRLLEAISFELYKSTDYWDIILVVNKMSSMNQLPVSYDMVLHRSEMLLQSWKDKMAKVSKELTDEDIKNKYNKILQEQDSVNEKYRNIKYIPMDDLSSLEADLIKQKNEVRINKNIIVKG